MPLPAPHKDAPLSRVLREAAPRRAGLKPLLFAIVSLLIARFCFFTGNDDAQAIVAETGVAYSVPYDPDLRRLEEAVAAARSARRANAPAPAKKIADLPPPAAGMFRVAAAQLYSFFGKTAINRRRMERFIEQAAKLHVQVLVFPEAALNGGCDLNEWLFWARDPQKSNSSAEAGTFYDVAKTAETADGENIAFFRKLARKHRMYIVVPFIERSAGRDSSAARYFNSALLLNPEGATALHYRKQRLLPTIDTAWADEPPPPAAYSVKTPFGRLGVLIGSDLHSSTTRLKEEKTAVILQSAALSGVNLDRWLNDKYPALLKNCDCAAVLANWAMGYTPDWEGFGMSRILDRDQRKVAAMGTQAEERLLVGDLKIITE